MVNAGNTAATNAAVQAAVVANAIKASGTIVKVEPSEFLKIVNLNEEPLVVHASGGFFSTIHKYLTSYRGLAFFTESKTPLPEIPDCQFVEAKTIWIPG